jgi:hypothetical protein
MIGMHGDDENSTAILLEKQMGWALGSIVLSQLSSAFFRLIRYRECSN